MRWKVLVLGVAGLVLAACPDAPQQTDSTAPSEATPTDVVSGGGPFPSPDTSSGSTATETGGRLRVAGCEPGSLWPADATGCAAPIARLLYAPLVQWDLDGSPAWGDDAPTALLADVRSDDGRRWTLELKPDRTHHDGSGVTADDVARGWQDAAFGPNARAFAHLFRDIDGFGDLRCGPTTECATAEVAPELDGLDVVDDHTLRVSLTSPDSQLPVRLGHVAFSPLPEAAETDPAAFGEQPVGTGVMRMDGPWRHDDRIVLVRADPESDVAIQTASPTASVSPSEERPTVPTAIEFVLLDAPAASMAGLRDDALDVVTGARAYDPVIGDGAERTGPGSAYTFLLWPGGPSDPRLSHALSLALDRAAVVGDALRGLARPAQTVVPDHLAGADPSSCGDPCGTDLDRAADLADAAGGFPDDALTIVVAAGLLPSQMDAIEQVAAQWEQALPPLTVDVEHVPVTDLRGRIEAAEPGELVRMSWSGDLPAPRAYLRPLHTPGGAFAFDGFDDPGVRAAIEAADATTTSSAAQQAYAQAERAVAATGHHVPLWFETVRVLIGPSVEDLVMGPQGLPRLEAATLRAVE